MTDVEGVTIESDERGFELHLVVGEDIDVSPDGVVVLNIQAVAEDLLNEAVRVIGPWVLEARAAYREYRAAGGHPMCPDEDGRCVHGQDEVCPRVDVEQIALDNLLHLADHVRKVYREGGAA